ncbi:competence type IV pilus minor pilin ComGG [Bacillus sp. CGMCC 1.16607]|uniref:competence type IV pilus minor pilin ComGG n=1 Tax=Bacillus sp. CGMCC 1.16607 TaxID=3351842 RepID=UPI00362E5D58
MNRNEKGLTYPVVLFIIVILSLFFTLQIQFYLSEQKLFQQSKNILKQEYYMYISFYKLEKSLTDNEFLNSTGQYHYYNGTANYRIESLSSTMMKASITIRMNTSEEMFGYGLYDKNKMKMVKWIEKN